MLPSLPVLHIIKSYLNGTLKLSNANIKFQITNDLVYVPSFTEDTLAVAGLTSGVFVSLVTPVAGLFCRTCVCGRGIVRVNGFSGFIRLIILRVTKGLDVIKSSHSFG